VLGDGLRVSVRMECKDNKNPQFSGGCLAFL